MPLPLSVSVSRAHTQERVERELLQCGVQLERFGGDVQCVHISALTVGCTDLLCSYRVICYRVVVCLNWKRLY